MHLSGQRPAASVEDGQGMPFGLNGSDNVVRNAAN